MNKQEVIEKLQSEARHHCGEKECYKDGCTKNVELDIAIDIVNQLDEPKKPVIPQFIDTWIQGAKYNGFDLYEAMTDETPDKTSTWIVCNPETFAKAWLYGYEVEKEKLYTVKFSNEDFGKIYIGIFKAVNKLGISSLPLNDDDVKSWFTEDELKRFKFWNNPAFEIREVEE